MPSSFLITFDKKEEPGEKVKIIDFLLVLKYFVGLLIKPENQSNEALMAAARDINDNFKASGKGCDNQWIIKRKAKILAMQTGKACSFY